MYCSKEKMVGSACTSSHSSRCLSKSDWSGDYLGDVIPSSGITVKIESDDKDFDDGYGILTNEVAVPDLELEGKSEVVLHDQELEGKDDIYFPDQELGGKCDVDVPDKEINENSMDVLLELVNISRVIKVGIIASDYIIFDDHRSLLCVMYGCNEERMDQYDMMIVLEHGLMAFELAIEIEEIINYLDINLATQIDEVVLRIQKSLNRYGNGNIDKGNVQQVRLQGFQKINHNWNSVLIAENVQFLQNVTGNHFQIQESNQNSVLDKENVQQFRFPAGKHLQILESNRNSVLVKENVQQLRFQIQESNENSVLDSEISCCFEPIVNVKRHGNNEEYYNFDQEENKNQENIKRTDHDPKEMIGKSTEHNTKSTNCSMFTTRILMILMMLPTFVMSGSTTERSHKQYLLHSDGRFSDQIVKMRNGKTELFIDNRVINDDSRVIQCDYRVIKEDDIVIQDDNRVIKEDDRVIQCDNRVIKDDNRVIKEDDIVIQDDNIVIQCYNRVIKDDNSSLDAGDEYGCLHVSIERMMRIIRLWNIPVQPILSMKSEVVLVKRRSTLYWSDVWKSAFFDTNHYWTLPEFEEDETVYLHMNEGSDQSDTNSVYVELSPVLKPHCFINLSELKALSQNVTLQKKAAKQKKTRKDSLSHEQTSTMFKVMIVCVLVVVAYLIIMERLSVVLSSTFKTSVPAALGLVVLSSYQMYYIVSIVVARMEIVRKKQIYDGNDGTHHLTEYERLFVVVYFCGSLVPWLWIYNEYTKKLDPVELLILCTTFCLPMMVVAWTAYLLHHMVLECLNGILLAARKVLVDSVAVVVRFVSVLRVFIVSLLEFIFKRLSEMICVILMIFVTMLEQVTRIEMLVTLMITRILEKLAVHSSIKAFQNDQITKCKLLFKRMLMNSDVIQYRITRPETAQCCNRIRSYGRDSNMEDVFCEIETEKVKHLQETTEGNKFIESVSEIDHGKELKDHSLKFDHEVCDSMERSETEIDEINYERSTTDDMFSNETIITKDLSCSTPVERDHEVCVSMEMSEAEIDETNYERSTTDDMFSNETIITKDLSCSTPVQRDHKVCDTMEKCEAEIDKISNERPYERLTTNDIFSNNTIILKDLSHSTPAERNYLSTKKSIHEETNVKRLVCNDAACSLDEDNLIRVELEDSEELSVEEFNITQVDDLNDDALQGSHGHLCSEDNDIAEQNVFDYIRSIEIEEDGEPFCRNTKLENDDEPFCHSTKSTSIDRYSNKVWSLSNYHMIPELNKDYQVIPELNKDYQVIPELNKGDISNTSMEFDSDFASNSLKNGSDDGSLSRSCSCDIDAHVFNCQVDSLHSFVNDSNNAMQSSRTVIDLQKRQESKSHSHIVDSKRKPLLKEMINENVPTTENVRTMVRNIIETVKQKSVSNLTKKSCKKCFISYRKKPRRRMTRRRLRRLIYPHGNISHVRVDIEARPHLNAPQRNATTNDPGNALNNVGAAVVATSQQSLMTSLPSSSNSLNDYFSKLLSGYEFSTDEKMQFEMLRVQSFQDLPASCNVSPLRLARAGFYSSGSGDKVTCFSCGVNYKGWQNNDNPNDVHRRISLDCRMVNGRETRNIPVSQHHNGIIEHSGQQESLAHTTNGFAQSTLHFDGDVSTQTTEATQNREMTTEEVIKSNFPDNIQQSTNIKPPVDQPPLDRTNSDQQYPRQPATDRESSVPDQNRPAQRDMAEDLGINLDKPKYPAYAQLNVRVSTFQGWPGYLDQTPRDMALAGFFYAGYNDYCRCFFCGGGLRNWDSGDDPWVEHTRWFPKCAFVQQNRGRRFVEIIVKRQAEMQASGNSVGNTRNQRAMKTGTGDRSETSSQTSSQSADSNCTIDPAKASVRELGYADDIIDRAITIIKQNNPGKQKIEATDIMEVIFTITEDSETNTAVASENTPSSELNLPSTSQAVPQSNVSSQSNRPVPHSSQSNKPQVSKPNPPTAVASQSTNASENSLPSLSVSSLEHGNAAAVKSTSKEISENEIRSLQEENIQLKEQVMCKICMDKNVSIAFLPCGHLACCIDCAPAMRKCPMCRVYIKGTVKTFLA